MNSLIKNIFFVSFTFLVLVMAVQLIFTDFYSRQCDGGSLLSIRNNASNFIEAKAIYDLSMEDCMNGKGLWW